MNRLTDFRLPTIDGGTLSLSDIQQRPATLLVFYKASCDTSVYALKLLNDFGRRRTSSDPLIYLISQDPPGETEAFIRRESLRLPVAVDYPEYRLSRQLDFRSVPAWYLVDGQGNIPGRSEGFVRTEVEHLLEELFRKNGQDLPPIFADPESVPALRPG